MAVLAKPQTEKQRLLNDSALLQRSKSGQVIFSLCAVFVDLCTVPLAKPPDRGGLQWSASLRTTASVSI